MYCVKHYQLFVNEFIVHEVKGVSVVSNMKIDDTALGLVEGSHAI